MTFPRVVSDLLMFAPSWDAKGKVEKKLQFQTQSIEDTIRQYTRFY